MLWLVVLVVLSWQAMSVSNAQLLIKIKMSLSVVIHLSVMAVNELVGYSHGSAGMAYAIDFTLFRMLGVGTKRFRFC